MELRDVMLKRRSIRKFTEQPVTDEEIGMLLEYAMSGPSACNKRPWEFYVVKNPELQEKLKSVSRYSNMNSTLIIIVAGNTKRSLSTKADDFWIQDCSAAIENILLGVTDMGLGACWCGLKPNMKAMKNVQDILGIEEWIEPLGLLHIGHPDEEQEARTQYDNKRVHIME